MDRLSLLVLMTIFTSSCCSSAPATSTHQTGDNAKANASDTAAPFYCWRVKGRGEQPESACFRKLDNCLPVLENLLDPSDPSYVLDKCSAFSSIWCYGMGSSSVCSPNMNECESDQQHFRSLLGVQNEAKFLSCRPVDSEYCFDTSVLSCSPKRIECEYDRQVSKQMPLVSDKVGESCQAID